jgi:hypothetical protein
MGEQQSCLQDCDQPPQFPGQFLPGQKLPACTALKKIATSRDAWRAAILLCKIATSPGKIASA